MANKTLNVTLIMRNGTSATWTNKNSILQLGEVGVETDTRKIKIGDGATAWNSLKYVAANETITSTTAPLATDKGYEVGTLWVVTTSGATYILTSKTDSAATWKKLIQQGDTVTAVEKATTATKLENDLKIIVQGDFNSDTYLLNNGKDANLNLVLKNSGVTAGTYTKLTVNAKGIITGAETITVADIPTLPLSKISDAGTAASKNVGTAAGNVPVLDNSGKLSTSILPAVAITETFVVANQTAMLALTAERGDIAIRTDENKTYILTTDDPTKIANWKVLMTPDCKVLSVNGKTGAITLTTADIAEGTNLYYTEARATSNFNTNFATKNSTDLKDGSHIVLDTDTLTISGGVA